MPWPVYALSTRQANCALSSPMGAADAFVRRPCGHGSRRLCAHDEVERLLTHAHGLISVCPGEIISQYSNEPITLLVSKHRVNY